MGEFITIWGFYHVIYSLNLCFYRKRSVFSYERDWNPKIPCMLSSECVCAVVVDSVRHSFVCFIGARLLVNYLIKQCLAKAKR